MCTDTPEHIGSCTGKLVCVQLVTPEHIGSGTDKLVGEQLLLIIFD